MRMHQFASLFRSRSAVLAIGILCSSAASTNTDVDQERQFALSNPSFEGSMSGWSDGSGYDWEESTEQSLHGAYSARVLGGGNTVARSLWTVLPLASQPDPVYVPQDMTSFGDKIAFGVWVYIDNATQGGAIVLGANLQNQQFNDLTPPILETI